MIAVDTSALMAIVLDEPEAGRCVSALESASGVLISAATVTEALIVAGRRHRADDMRRLVDGLGLTIVDLTPAAARRAAEAYAKWGKGVHPAALNFGDCFAYELAQAKGCGLLFVGKDFSRTDLQVVA